MYKSDFLPFKGEIQHVYCFLFMTNLYCFIEKLSGGFSEGEGGGVGGGGGFGI